MTSLEDFVAGVRLSFDAIVKTFAVDIVRIRLRDQLVVLIGSYVFIFVSLMPVLLPLSLFGLVNIGDVWWSLIRTNSVLGVMLRSIAFPISLHFLAPLFATELFFAVLVHTSPTLHAKLQGQSASTPMSVWLPVHLSRALPLLAVGAILWLASKTPLVGPLATGIGHFFVLRSILQDAKVAAGAALAVFLTGSIGSSALTLFLTARSLGGEQVDLFLFRHLELLPPSQLGEGDVSARKRYVGILQRRKDFYREHLAFVVGFAAPFAAVTLYVPFGFVSYVIAMGAAAVLAAHIYETTKDKE